MKHSFIAISLWLGIALVAPVVAQEPDAKPADAAPVDPGWPRTFEKDGNRVTVHQPQIDSWKDYSHVAFRSALSVLPSGEKKEKLGILAGEADTTINHTTRTVLLTEPQVEIRFASLPPDEAAKLEGLVRDFLPNRPYLELSLDRILAYLSTDQGVQREVSVGLDPPKIFHSSKPAILVMFMGAPRFKPAADSGLMFATNTNWDLFMDPATSRYYLLDEDQWLTADDIAATEWKSADALPAGFAKLPDDDMWKDAKAHLSPKPAAKVPAVIISNEPAELILTEGEPEFTPLSGTKLMVVANSESTVIQDMATKQLYFLASGRWFSAASLAGPWTAATTSLPPDFQKIPEDSPGGYVLSSVPGTDEAEDAVLLASIPEKARVNPKEAKIEVQYKGEPKFEPIEKTEVKYALNTFNDVFLVGSRYYCCLDGVWFEATSATGPWTVCAQVPESIYTIPVSHPKHNVTYVRVYKTTPDYVEVGYTAGYSGQYVSNRVLVFGAGLALGAWIAKEARDDDYVDYRYYHYYARPYWYGYGSGAIYNPYRGGYYHGHIYYGPGGGAGRVAFYNPYTGAYVRRAYAYSPISMVHATAGYNPWTGNWGARAGGSGIYGSWGRTVVSNGDDWARAGHTSGPRGSVGWVETSNGGKGVAIDTGRRQGGVIKTGNDDIYAGANGNVYRREDGNWQKWDNGGWDDVDRNRSRSESARSLADRGTKPATMDEARGRAQGQRDRRPGTLDNPSTNRPAQGRPATSDSPLRARGPAAGQGSFQDQMNRQARARTYGNTQARQYSNPSSSVNRTSPSRSSATRRSAAPSRSAPSRSAPSRGGGRRR